jgi:hypothetical protein
MGINRRFFYIFSQDSQNRTRFFYKMFRIKFSFRKCICFLCEMVTSGVIGRFKVILWAVLRFFLHFKSG